MRFKLNKKGFTLIELLAVIVVLAIIMVIASTNVLGFVKKSKRTAFKSSGENIKRSIKNKIVQDYLDDNTAKIECTGKECNSIYDLSDDYNLDVIKVGNEIVGRLTGSSNGKFSDQTPIYFKLDNNGSEVNNNNGNENNNLNELVISIPYFIKNYILNKINNKDVIQEKEQCGFSDVITTDEIACDDDTNKKCSSVYNFLTDFKNLNVKVKVTNLYNGYAIYINNLNINDTNEEHFFAYNNNEIAFSISKYGTVKKSKLENELTYNRHLVHSTLNNLNDIIEKHKLDSFRKPNENGIVVLDYCKEKGGAKIYGLLIREVQIYYQDTANNTYLPIDRIRLYTGTENSLTDSKGLKYIEPVLDSDNINWLFKIEY